MKRSVPPFVPTLEQRPALNRRREPQQRRSHELVADILIAAERLLVAEGAAAVTSQRIAEVAGVSVGSLYQYFPTSLAVLRALLERHLATLAGELAEAISSANEPTLLLSDLLDAFLIAKQRRGALSLALREVEPLIEGQVVEQQTVRQVARLFLERLAQLEVTPRGHAPWQVELMVAALAGAVGQALESDPTRLSDPAFKSSLLRMATGALA